jgi:hypothetical protein
VFPPFGPERSTGIAQIGQSEAEWVAFRLIIGYFGVKIRAKSHERCRSLANITPPVSHHLLGSTAVAKFTFLRFGGFRNDVFDPDLVADGPGTLLSTFKKIFIIWEDASQKGISFESITFFPLSSQSFCVNKKNTVRSSRSRLSGLQWYCFSDKANDRSW